MDVSINGITRRCWPTRNPWIHPALEYWGQYSGFRQETATSGDQDGTNTAIVQIFPSLLVLPRCSWGESLPAMQLGGHGATVQVGKRLPNPQQGALPHSSPKSATLMKDQWLVCATVAYMAADYNVCIWVFLIDSCMKTHSMGLFRKLQLTVRSDYLNMQRILISDVW